MNLTRLRYFLEVERSKSITTAAKACFISQTAMSQQMEALERELEVPLFYRSKTGTTLTPEGKALVPHAKKILHDYELMCKKMHELSEQNRTITVAYTGPLEKCLLRLAIPAFANAYPDTQVQIRQVLMSKIEDTLVHHECDIALAIPGEILKDDVREYEIMRQAIYAAVAENHPLAQKTSVLLSELIDYPVILLREESAHHVSKMIAEWLLNLGWKQSQIRYADTIETQLLMVSLGQGISMMPAGTKSDGIKLVPLITNAQPFEHITAAYTLHNTSLLTAFVQALRQAAQRFTDP